MPPPFLPVVSCGFRPGKAGPVIRATNRRSPANRIDVGRRLDPAGEKRHTERMYVDNTRVVRHESVSGGYRLIQMAAPSIAERARPGQFVHLKVPHLETAALRRPFSIYAAGEGCVSVLYKDVGRGTHAMVPLGPDDTVSLLGPLGNSFPLVRGEHCPVLVAGGYGVAPLSFFASRCARRGILFVGGRTSGDILCLEDFERLGWDIRVTTEDGSMGQRGRVTSALDEWLAARSETDCPPELYACGPDGLLRAVGERAMAAGADGWLSLDKHMGCAVGACLACVQTIRQPDGSLVKVRVCRDGPIFEARTIVWEDAS